MSQKLADLFDTLANFTLERRKEVEAKRGRRCREYHVMTAEIHAYWNCRDLARNMEPKKGEVIPFPTA